MSTTQQPSPTAPRKPIYKRVWLWLIVAAVVIAAIASSKGSDDGATGAAPSTGGPQVSAPAAEQPAAAGDPLTDDGWTASDIQIETTAIGPSISARITNNEDKARTGVFTLTVFSGGKRVYDAMGSANEVEAGGTATVTFVSTSQKDIPGDPATFTYELQADL